ncbi:outer membrane porin, OprD family [compost metagenome]
MYDVEHWSQINDFLERDQRSEFLRYDLNFPPLRRAGSALHAPHQGGRSRPGNLTGKGEEWVRDLDILYVVQNGPLRFKVVRSKQLDRKLGNQPQLIHIAARAAVRSVPDTQREILGCP